TDDGGQRPMIALPRIPLGRALPADQFQLTLDSGNAILDAPAVGFQLRFTLAAAHTDAAFLPRQVAPKTRQARQQMLKLRQFNLQLAFPGPGALGKDIEDERSAIQY